MKSIRISRGLCADSFSDFFLHSVILALRLFAKTCLCRASNLNLHLMIVVCDKLGKAHLSV